MLVISLWMRLFLILTRSVSFSLSHTLTHYFFLSPSVSLQTEIAKRLNVICAQLIPFLSQEVRRKTRTHTCTHTHTLSHTPPFWNEMISWHLFLSHILSLSLIFLLYCAWWWMHVFSLIGWFHMLPLSTMHWWTAWTITWQRDKITLCHLFKWFF